MCACTTPIRWFWKRSSTLDGGRGDFVCSLPCYLAGAGDPTRRLLLKPVNTIKVIAPVVAQERKPPHHVKEPVSVKGGIVTFGACPLVATGIRLRPEMSRRSHGLTSSFDMIFQHREVGVHLVEYLPQDIQYVVVAHLKRRTRRYAA